MTQDGGRAARQDRGHLSSQRRLDGADEIHAPVHRAQPAATHAPVHAVWGHPRSDELATRDDAMLPRRDPRDHRVGILDRLSSSGFPHHDCSRSTAPGSEATGIELTLIHIPTEAEEQVRDLVRCRETFQREILKSRHYILKFLRRRGFVFRGGMNWTQRHFVWIRQLLRPGVLSEEDRLVLSEYLALLEYKLSRRDELDRQVERLALEPR